MDLFGNVITIWGAGWGVSGAAFGTAVSNAFVGLLMFSAVMIRENPLKPVGCMLSERVGRPFTQDEQMVLDRRELEEMLDIISTELMPELHLPDLPSTTKL